MSLDDPRSALRNIADQLPGLQAEVEGLRKEVQKDRRKIRWIIVACIVLTFGTLTAVSWTAYQQSVLDGKSAAISRLEDQNAANAVVDARNSRDLCVKLNQSRAVLGGVWAQVLAGRPDGAALLAKVRAAEPLGKCR